MKTQRRLLHLSIALGFLLWLLIFAPTGDEDFKCVVIEEKPQPWLMGGRR